MQVEGIAWQWQVAAVLSRSSMFRLNHITAALVASAIAHMLETCLSRCALHGVNLYISWLGLSHAEHHRYSPFEGLFNRVALIEVFINLIHHCRKWQLCRTRLPRCISSPIDKLSSYQNHMKPLMDCKAGCMQAVTSKTQPQALGLQVLDHCHALAAVFASAWNALAPTLCRG